MLKVIPGLELVEFAASKKDAICCGGGGGRIWAEIPKGERLCDLRLKQAIDLGAEVLAVAGPGMAKAVLRQVRKVLRLTGRLARYWDDPDRNLRLPADWRLAVDEALGSRGWEPALAVALIGLDAEPSPELYAEVQQRWRQVRFEPWMEGVSYAQWRERQSETGGSGEPA